MTRSLIPFNRGLTLFDDFRSEMDSLMNRFFGEDGGEAAAWTPRLNLAESDAGYELTVDLPGMKPEDVDIELRHGDLWITGTRKTESEEKGKTWHRIERSCGEFRRVVRLGDDVKADDVQAEFKDGVLHISVPKSEQARAKKIEIKS